MVLLLTGSTHLWTQFSCASHTLMCTTSIQFVYTHKSYLHEFNLLLVCKVRPIHRLWHGFGWLLRCTCPSTLFRSKYRYVGNNTGNTQTCITRVINPFQYAVHLNTYIASGTKHYFIQDCTFWDVNAFIFSVKSFQNLLHCRNGIQRIVISPISHNRNLPSFVTKKMQLHVIA
jgi:hypothetical protein